jgi:hypothetical protein
LGRQIINTKRSGPSPRTILRAVIFAVVLVSVAVVAFVWLERPGRHGASHTATSSSSSMTAPAPPRA